MTPEETLAWLGVTSLTATLLAGAVVALREPVRRAFGAGAVVALWTAPALRLFMPPLGLGLIVLPWSASVRPQAVPPDLPAHDAALPSYELAQPVPAALPLAEAPPEASLPFAAMAIGVWLAGACLTLCLSLLRTDAWRRALARAGTPAPSAVASLAREAAHETGHRGRFDVVLSEAAVSPQVIGLFRPLIALPTDFGTRFTPTEQRLALLHEVTHLARRDLWIAFAAEAACALHWFNPLLARCLPTLRADQEAACDERVRSLGAPAPDYAGALLRAAAGPSVPALTLNHDLKRRIETMKTPLPRTATRMLGTGAALAIALGAAAATQESGDPNFDPAEATAEGRGGSSTSERSVWSWRDGDEAREVRVVRGGETDMVLLSDPFAALMPLRPEPPTPPAPGTADGSVRVPPPPPVPMAVGAPGRVVIVGEDGETRRVVELSEGERFATENGGQVIVVPGIDEAAMRAFETDMEAWSESFEVEMEGFGEVMGEFGDRMGAWGEEMGRAGEAIGELAERCENHREATGEPAILEQPVEGSDETVKAVCARGGAERYASAEMERFVDRQGGLTAAEKAAFRENRARGAVSVSAE